MLCIYFIKNHLVLSLYWVVKKQRIFSLVSIVVGLSSSLHLNELPENGNDKESSEISFVYTVDSKAEYLNVTLTNKIMRNT